jgi:hypothetical protein
MLSSTVFDASIDLSVSAARSVGSNGTSFFHLTSPLSSSISASARGLRFFMTFFFNF